MGGALKRSADRIVAHGGDIPDAQSLYDELKSLDTSVELFYVPERDIESKTEVPTIAAIKGTMRIHQVISLKPDKMKYRDILCLCKREEGVLDCPCFNLQDVTLANISVSSDESAACGKTPDNSRRPEMMEVKHIGEWCVVNYDNEAYPTDGTICWYHDWQVLCLIPEPQALNKRSVQIEASAWKYVEQQLQN